MPVAPENFNTLSAPPAAGEKFLVFLVGEEFYAVASKAVAEVGALACVTRLPNAPAWLLGITNLRGEIVPVVNSPAVLPKQNAHDQPARKFIVLRSAFFEFGAALAATRISEIQTFPAETIRTNSDAATAHIFGVTDYQTNTLNLIDTEKLFSTLRV